MTALCVLRKILRAAQARQDGGALKFIGGIERFYGMLGRGAQEKSNGYFSFTQSSRFAFNFRFVNPRIPNTPYPFWRRHCR